jgi:hypothetical protein
VESTPRAYRLKAGNAASPISTFSGAILVVGAIAFTTVIDVGRIAIGMRHQALVKALERDDEGDPK